MYRVSPFTYLIEGLIGQGKALRLQISAHHSYACSVLFSAVGRFEVNCSSSEFVTLEPPSGQTCSQYMSTYIADHGGYLQNPDASASCNFCTYRTSDQFLQSSFNIFYSHRWRNVGLMVVYFTFNVSIMSSPARLELTFRIITGCYGLCLDVPFPYPVAPLEHFLPLPYSNFADHSYWFVCLESRI